ncbi:hypothetical protein BDV93DRAFT_17753 [Ceratobasidium sp. AG-I]|nr:hypothetical protein BDV93DRAFT_17753 [Ceratobasidium sp. AG-I]
MSDDEYFDNDDIFTSAELDAIPLLNQLPSAPLPVPGPATATAAVPPLPFAPQAPGTSQSNPIILSEGSSNTASTSLQRSNTVSDVQPQNVASTSNHARQLAQASGSRTSGARLSAIMNALRSTQSGPSTSQLPAQQSEIFGRPIGLLPFNTPKPSSNPEARKRTSPSSSEGSPTRKNPRKRSRQSPSTGAKRRRSSSCSPSKAVLEAVAREGKVEGLEMLEDELTCAICCDVYVAPQVTPCGHTACGVSIYI